MILQCKQDSFNTGWNARRDVLFFIFVYVKHAFNQTFDIDLRKTPW